MRFAGETTLAVLAFALPAVLGQHVRDLGSEEWTLSGGALNRTVPGRLPSQVHLDLFEAVVIGE